MDGPLFKFDDRRVFTRPCFVSAVRIGLEKTGIDFFSDVLGQDSDIILAKCSSYTNLIATE